jgi:hypothetical protein
MNTTYDPNIIDIPIITGVKKEESIVEPTFHEINDVRTPAEFRGYTFSNYKKIDAKKLMIDAMNKSKVEPACYWCVEMVCAGHFADIWEIIIFYTSKYIHLGNPKIAIYLDMRYSVFRNIMNQNFHASEIDVRNNPKIRRLFAEIICTITLSDKKPSLEQVKINSSEEFDMTQMSNKLRADSTQYIDEFFKPKDPRGLYIALNEFAYAISSTGSNMASACYWTEWILEFETICKRRKEPVRCVNRQYTVGDKFRGNIIWILWDILSSGSEKHSNGIVDKTMKSLLNLFCIKYTDATSKRRRYLLYYAIGLLTESVPLSGEILPNRDLLQTVTNQVEELYKQVKKNEHTPNTEYLFNGLDKKRALEQSIKQMELVGQIDTTTTPFYKEGS